MKACCLAEARKSLKKHRDVAICDDCGRLVLAYGSDRDYDSAVEELTRRKAPFETAPLESLKVIAKARTRSRP